MAGIFDEAAGHQELARYAGLDTMRDGAFDDVAALVARFFHVPFAIISLQHGERVWLKTAFGLRAARKSGLDQDSWAALILGRPGPDGGETGGSAANDNGLRFHAAAPLLRMDGHQFGSLCIGDIEPRPFSRDDEQMLARFGRIVMLQIEQRLVSRQIGDLVQEHGLEDTLFNDLATHDMRTGLLSRGAMLSHLQALCDLGGGDPHVATLLIDVDHLQAVNDMHGQAAGDAVLIEVARRIQSAMRPNDLAGRFGGTEFLALLVDCDRRTAARIAERVRQSVDRVPVRYRDRDIFVTLSVGVYLPAGRMSSDDALRAADDALFSARQGGSNRVVISRFPAHAVSVSG